MATLAPPASPLEALYRPRTKGDSRKVGEVLRQMQRDGRQVIQQRRGTIQMAREFYRGNQYVHPNVTGTSLKRLAPSTMLRSGRRRDTINMIQPLVDSRVALLTSETPSYEVVPASRSQDQVDAARLGKKLVDANWDNPRGWDVAAWRVELAQAAEIDGVAFANVYFDRLAGGYTSVAVEFGPRGPVPVTDLGRYAALREMDPSGQSLWRENHPYPVGEVCFRVARVGGMSIDPTVRTVKSWDHCRWVIEGRVRPISEVNGEYGVDVLALRKTYAPARASGFGDTTAGGIDAESPDGSPQTFNRRTHARVFEAFIVAHGDWPAGAHILWMEDAPDEPFVAEPWQEQDGAGRPLPYFPFVPRPDAGHLLLCGGTVEALIPTQVQLNRSNSQLNEWQDLMARPPLVLYGGQLRSQSVFNEQRVVMVNGGFGPPSFMQVPTEPTAVISQRIPYLERKMAEIANMSSPARGQVAIGTGAPESNVAYRTLIQQGEQDMSITEMGLTRATQWAVSEALRLASRNYTIERVVTGPGVDDVAEFQAFAGSMLRGCDNFRITGATLPRSRALDTQNMIQFLQIAGPRFDPAPYAAEIIGGDVDSIMDSENDQKRRQVYELTQLRALGASKFAKDLRSNFTQMRDTYIQAVGKLEQELQAQYRETGVAPPEGAQQILGRMGVKPPRVIDLARKAGLRVPTVEDSDVDHAHLKTIAHEVCSPAWDSFPEIVRQATREHAQEHQEKVARNVFAIGQQAPPPMGPQGSDPNPRGEPSPPKYANPEG